MNAAALPTRRDEAWRYADLDAVARLWPVGPAERIVLAAGERGAWTLIAEAGIHDFAVEVAAGARFDFHLLASAPAYTRVALDVTLGEGAHFELGGVLLGRGDATVELVTTVRHAAPDATSNQVVRAVLGERATGSFLGTIAVARGADGTDAAQSVKALLLDRTATANLKPELEIFADDVKCAHGATVGELSKDALFYLASRGVGPAEARALLTEAFIGDALADEALRERALDWLRG